MFDPEWLDVLEEDELLEHYDWCRSHQKSHRRTGNYALAWWYGQGALETCDALGRFYMEKRSRHFNRRQLPIEGLAPGAYQDRWTT